MRPPERPDSCRRSRQGARVGDDHLQDVRHAPVAKVNDARAKRLRLDQLQVDPFVQGREVGRAAGVAEYLRCASELPGPPGSLDRPPWLEQLLARGVCPPETRSAINRTTNPADPRRLLAAFRRDWAHRTRGS